MHKIKVYWGKTRDLFLALQRWSDTQWDPYLDDPSPLSRPEVLSILSTDPDHIS